MKYIKVKNTGGAVEVNGTAVPLQDFVAFEVAQANPAIIEVIIEQPNSQCEVYASRYKSGNSTKYNRLQLRCKANAGGSKKFEEAKAVSQPRARRRPTSAMPALVRKVEQIGNDHKKLKMRFGMSADHSSEDKVVTVEVQ